MDKHYRNEHWPERQPEGRTQPRDIGEESEAEARERATEEWDLQTSEKIFDFLFDRAELSLPIAQAAIAYEATPSEMNRIALRQVIDAAKQAFIQWRLR